MNFNYNVNKLSSTFSLDDLQNKVPLAMGYSEKEIAVAIEVFLHDVETLCTCFMLEMLEKRTPIELGYSEYQIATAISSYNEEKYVMKRNRFINDADGGNLLTDKHKTGQCTKNIFSDCCYDCPDSSCTRQGDIPF